MLLLLLRAYGEDEEVRMGGGLKDNRACLLETFAEEFDCDDDGCGGSGGGVDDLPEDELREMIAVGEDDEDDADAVDESYDARTE
jgi:hypothetical protein